jgi:hypothetical protein
MFHGRNDISQRVLGSVDLAIDFATLGEYGLEPFSADGSRRQRADRRPATSRRPGWEARAATPRGACGTSRNRSLSATHPSDTPTHAGKRIRTDWRFPSSGSKPVDFRAAIRRYSA